MAIVKIVEIPVSKLHFDPENPRLPTSLAFATEVEVINWMLKDASIIELMGSIGEKGFFPAEPLLVVEDSENPKNYFVVEGNRRLSAAKLLLNPEKATKRASAVATIQDQAKNKPEKLPAIIYPKREDILDYLGFKHITGVKSWTPLAKAKYLNSLQSNYTGLSILQKHQALARAIGSRSDYVQQLLTGLSLFNAIQEKDYFDIPGLNEEAIEFGVYYNALRWSNINKFLGVNSSNENPVSDLKFNNLKEFVSWVSEKNAQNKTRLGESRNLTNLNKILGSTKALDVFRSGKSITESILYTEEPDKVFVDSVSDALSNITTANNYLHMVSKIEQLVIDNLKEIKKLAANQIVLSESRLNEED